MRLKTAVGTLFCFPRHGDQTMLRYESRNKDTFTWVLENSKNKHRVAILLNKKWRQKINSTEYRVFLWLGLFPTHDLDLWNTTSGKQTPFWAFGKGPSAENVGKSQEKCKNNALGKMTVLGPFWGPWMTTTCQRRSPCFDMFPNVSSDFCISHAIFILFLANCIFHFVFPCVFTANINNTTHTYSTPWPCCELSA